ncbi:MAG: aminotransferase class V-fold PLP-dependent enzyme [Byssovorax sp.]
METYLDCNATTALDPSIRREVLRYMTDEYGNAASRTHAFGLRARDAVRRASALVASVAGANEEDVIFTSGATESNNLALLGLLPHGERRGLRHIVSTQIEHGSVLGPLAVAAGRGFEVTLIRPLPGGWVDPDMVRAAVRADTLAVSVMQVNNETGIVQPIEAIADRLRQSEAYFHVDAAQGFGKSVDALRHPRIDLLSVSGHKLFAPKGVGALIARRRAGERPPLAPILFGGGQQGGLRPGTLPVPLVVGLGLAAEAALRDHDVRASACRAFRAHALGALSPLDPLVHGDPARALPHVLNLSFPGVDAEALMMAWRGIIAVSNGAACTSRGHEGSHVLRAMGLDQASIDGAVRLSWSHRTEEPDWGRVVDAVRRLR